MKWCTQTYLSEGLRGGERGTGGGGTATSGSVADACLMIVNPSPAAAVDDDDDGGVSALAALRTHPALSPASGPASSAEGVGADAVDASAAIASSRRMPVAPHRPSPSVGEAWAAAAAADRRSEGWDPGGEAITTSAGGRPVQ